MAETAYVKSYAPSKRSKPKRTDMSGYRTGHKKTKKATTGGTKHVVASNGSL